MAKRKRIPDHQRNLPAHFEYWHNNPPAPFNDEARGDEYGRALHREYAAFCEAHPELPSRHADLVAAHADISTRLAAKFPTWGECQADPKKVWNRGPSRQQRDAAYRARRQNV